MLFGGRRIVDTQFADVALPQLKNNSPRWKCMRRFVLSVLPTTRNTKGGLQTNGATPADITQFIAEPAIWMPSSIGVRTHPWCGINLWIRLSVMRDS